MPGLLLASFSSSFVSSFCTRLLLLQQSCKSPGLIHLSKGIPKAPPPHTHTRSKPLNYRCHQQNQILAFTAQVQDPGRKGRTKVPVPIPNLHWVGTAGTGWGEYGNSPNPGPFFQRKNAICLGQTRGIGPGLREGPPEPGPVHIEPERRGVNCTQWRRGVGYFLNLFFPGLGISRSNWGMKDKGKQKKKKKKAE